MTNNSGDTSRGVWIPPSDALELREGMWQTKAVSKISYPGEANDVCFQVEDESFWFNHRNRCIMAAIAQFRPEGMLYDVGGGNGFVAAGLQAAGMEVALVEPGVGARNALKRGVRNVVCATFQDACFRERSLPAAGAFDVVEHIEDDVGFLRSLRERLIPGGKFYCTVPALSALWSGADEHAGHFRRYNRASMVRTFVKAGFEIEFTSYFFAWLTPPIFMLRAVPARMGIRDKANYGSIEAARAVHRHPAVISGAVEATERWELGRLRVGKQVPFGTSLLCVARVPVGKNEA